jgi:hypothetical protein
VALQSRAVGKCAERALRLFPFFDMPTLENVKKTVGIGCSSGRF